jgi:HK97 family phage major capsid protein
MSIATAFPHVRTSLVESEVDKKLPTGGYRSAGHFASDVLHAFGPSPDADAARRIREWQALATRAITGLGEVSDSEGGALIPPLLAKQLWSRAGNYPLLTDFFDLLPLAQGNRIVIPAVLESSRASTRSGGTVGYWEAEAAQHTSTFPRTRGLELKLKKLTVRIPATQEVLEDSAGAIELLLDRAAPEEIAFKLNDALINGPGAGMPLGILAAPATIVVDKEGSQTAATVNRANISKMWARLYGPSRRNAVWLANQDVEDQLDSLFIAAATGSPSGQMTYAAPANGSPYATLKGRPLIPVESCATLGTVGDIILADLTQYVGAVRSGGVRRAASIHVRFDFDETVFVYSLRCDFQPYWDAPLTPAKGAATPATQSPFIALQTRS